MIERVLVDESIAGPINMTAPRPSTAVQIRDCIGGSGGERRAALRKALLAASSQSRAAVDASSPAATDGDSDAETFRSRSHWAYPAKLLQAGYRWRVTSISDALEPSGPPTRADPTRSPSSLGRRRTAHETGDIPVSWMEAGSGYPLVVCSAAALPYEYWSTVLGFLSIRYRTFFLHPRGLWGGHLPVRASEMSVADHARDLSFLVRHLGLTEYGIVGHCAGVPSVVAGLSLLQVRPRRVLLVSSRLSPGPALAKIETVAGLVHTNPQFRLQYARVAAAYAPPELRQRLEQQLLDARELEAHIYAVQSVREHRFDDPWPRDVHATLAWASGDAADIRSSMREYAERLGPQCRSASEFDGNHFTFLTDVAAAGRVVEAAFGDEARAHAA